MKRWLSALAPVALYALAIFLVSGQSQLPPTRIWDKAAHFCEYTLFAFLICRAVLLLKPMAPVRAAICAVALATAFGVTDEIHQFFVPGRDSSPYDLLADFLGSTAGATAYLVWLQLLGLIRRPRPAAE